MLWIENLTKRFGNAIALDGLNMKIDDGELYGFIGPNGAGKTTTIRILMGLMAPDSGTVILNDVDVVKEPKKVASQIGYVPDEFGMYDNLKVSEYMEFFASCYGLDGLNARKRSMTLLSQVGLDDKADFYVESLSKGMKQRLSLARALIHDPSFLILDEPTAGLDPRTRFEFKEIMRELKDQNKTILISSHILSEISEICTDIGIIDQGKIVYEGSMNEIIDQINVSTPLLISVNGDTDDALAFLRSRPDIESIMIRGEDIMVTFNGDRREESALLSQLIDAGIQVCSFTREQGDLESVFMQITDHDEGKVVSQYED